MKLKKFNTNSLIPLYIFTIFALIILIPALATLQFSEVNPFGYIGWICLMGTAIFMILYNSNNISIKEIFKQGKYHFITMILLFGILRLVYGVDNFSFLMFFITIFIAAELIYFLILKTVPKKNDNWFEFTVTEKLKSLGLSFLYVTGISGIYVLMTDIKKYIINNNINLVPYIITILQIILISIFIFYGVKLYIYLNSLKHKDVFYPKKKRRGKKK